MISGDIDKTVSEALRQLLLDRICTFGHTMSAIRFSDVLSRLPAAHALDLRNRVLLAGWPPSMMHTPLSAFEVFDSVDEGMTIWQMVEDRRNAFGLQMTPDFAGEIKKIKLEITIYRVDQEQAA